MGLPDEPKRPRSKALDPAYGRQKKSRKQEERIAKKVGGRRVSGSGNKNIARKNMGGLGVPDAGTATGLSANRRDYAYSPGDVTHDSFLFEAKRTDAKSIRIEGAWLTKIEAEAARVGKIPALTFEIGGLFAMTEKDWVAVPVSVFNKLFNDGGEDE